MSFVHPSYCSGHALLLTVAWILLSAQPHGIKKKVAEKQQQQEKFLKIVLKQKVVQIQRKINIKVIKYKSTERKLTEKRRNPAGNSISVSRFGQFLSYEKFESNHLDYINMAHTKNDLGSISIEVTKFVLLQSLVLSRRRTSSRCQVLKNCCLPGHHSTFYR